MDSKEVHVYHADAGAGKTYQLMDIISKHVKAGVPLHRIALVTYTKAAAEVAKQRVCEQFGVNIKEAPHFRTIHSMCFQRVGAKVNEMMDNEKYLDFGKKAGYNFSAFVGSKDLDGVDWQHMKDDEIVSFEQLYRNHTKKAQWILDNKIDNIDFVRYCREYVKYKKTFGYKDFTDLLEMYVDNDFYEDVDVACIDEAQDCTPLQWKVLFKAFRYAKYIYIVGDEKQSIYSFNGGEPRILLDMKGVQHTMDKSWRVPKNINDFVKKHIVSDMKEITPTELLSAHDGGEVKYITTLDELPSINLNKSYLFLTRNRKFFPEIEHWCRQHCIPYRLRNKPVFTNEDKMQFRDGLTSTWEPNKLAMAQRYYARKTLFEQPVVHIDTIHGVKGDEADIVVLFTDVSRLTWKELEENPESEHRVFYVGCTRAKETLYIVSPETRYYYSYLF